MEEKSIREIIESHISEAGMTKKQFAEKIGRTQGSLNNMLSSPSWPSLEKMAAVLNLSVQQLVSDGQPMQGELSIKCEKCGSIIKIKEIKVEQ
jgi:lambda repressor-like predicted transcriptional regulator